MMRAPKCQGHRSPAGDHVPQGHTRRRWGTQRPRRI